MRATENVHGSPISSSRKCRTPRAYVSPATMPNDAVPKKSCVTERQRSHNGFTVVCFSRAMNGSGSSPRTSPSVRRNVVVECRPIGAWRYGTSRSSHSIRPNSRYRHTFASASTRRGTSARWLPNGNTMFTSAPIPSTRRRTSARSLYMLNWPYAGPMMFTRGRSPAARSRRFGRTPFLRPYSVHSQYIARFAACH